MLECLFRAKDDARQCLWFRRCSTAFLAQVKDDDELLTYILVELGPFLFEACNELLIETPWWGCSEKGKKPTPKKPWQECYPSKEKQKTQKKKE